MEQLSVKFEKKNRKELSAKLWAVVRDPEFLVLKQGAGKPKVISCEIYPNFDPNMALVKHCIINN